MSKFSSTHFSILKDPNASSDILPSYHTSSSIFKHEFNETDGTPKIFQNAVLQIDLSEIGRDDDMMSCKSMDSLTSYYSVKRTLDCFEFLQNNCVLFQVYPLLRGISRTDTFRSLNSDDEGYLLHAEVSQLMFNGYRKKLFIT